ncbi:amidohydrolase family protein [Roseomonas sp. F4]
MTAILIVDSQVHVWSAEPADQPWPQPSPAVVQRPVPLLPRDLLGEMDRAGVDRAILVPPSWEGFRNALSLEAARRFPDRFAVMGRLPIEAQDSRDRFAEWRFLPGLLGARLNFRRAAIRQLRDGTADWIFRQAERDGLALMLFVNEDFPAVAAIAERHPGLRLIIDHMGAHVERRGPAAFDHLPDLLRLSQWPNIAIKASALPCAAEDAYPFASLYPFLKASFDAFGPARMFWGSDLTRLPCDYRDAVTMFTDHLPWLRGEDLALVMGKALCRWLNWSTE